MALDHIAKWLYSIISIVCIRPRGLELVVDKRKVAGRLKERVEALRAFDLSIITTPATPPEIGALQTAIDRTLSQAFKPPSRDYDRYADATKLTPQFMVAFEGYPAAKDYRESIATKIQNSVHLLEEAIEALNEEIADEEEIPVNAPASSTSPDTVFVVHGHDEKEMQTVARFLERIGLKALILHEQVNAGRTILTKFQEEAARAAFAVVLMTPDDEGGPKGGATKDRARQNVVFEFGFFFGALGMSKVAALVKGKVERPSDIDGLVYLSLDTDGWKNSLARELAAAGYQIDFQKVVSA